MKAIFFALLMVAACSSQVRSVEPGIESMVPGASAPKEPTVVLHADNDFTPPERTDIALAAELWGIQTSGLAKITVIYDVDFASEPNIKQHVELSHNLVVRLQSYLVPEEGLLGYVGPSGGIHNPYKVPLRMAFVTDRCEESSARTGGLPQVALHELGHALGIPHQEFVGAVMYKYAVRHQALCLKRADLAAFCVANDCKNHKMYPCE